MKKKVGQVTLEEKNEILALYERRNSLTELAKILTADNAELYEKLVKDLGLPAGATIGGLVRNGVGMLVSGNSQIEAGDSVMVFCHEAKLKQIEKFFNKTTIW